MMPTPAINRVRDLLDGDLFKSQSGTGTTAPTVDDTSLETPDSNTLDTPTTTTTDQAIQVTASIASTVGTGNAYSEQETQMNSGNIMLNRVVHTPITKGAKDQYTYITNFFIKRG